MAACVCVCLSLSLSLCRWYGGVGGGSLHEDGEFPVSWRSLGERRLSSGVRWLRPHELCARPHFRGEQRAAPSPRAHTEHTAHEDYDDDDPTTWCVEAGGALGAGGAAVCAAAAALSLAPRLLERAVPPQSFVRGYTGAFRFRFWVFGAWRDVVVDDRLPTRGGRVLGATSARPDDFTLPLLHKAYAKLYGSYAALRGASAARALQDLTGAVVQSFALRLQPPALAFQVLNSAAPPRGWWRARRPRTRTCRRRATTRRAPTRPPPQAPGAPRARAAVEWGRVARGRRPARASLASPPCRRRSPRAPRAERCRRATCRRSRRRRRRSCSPRRRRAERTRLRRTVHSAPRYTNRQIN